MSVRNLTNDVCQNPMLADYSHNIADVNHQTHITRYSAIFAIPIYKTLKMSTAILYIIILAYNYLAADTRRQ